MMKLLQSIQRGLLMLIRGKVTCFAKEIYRRINSTEYTYVLRRDFRKPHEPPKAKIAIQVRELKPKDVDKVFEHGQRKEVEPDAVAYQEKILNSKAPEHYVAVDQEDNPAYIQCLVRSDASDQFKDEFGEYFPDVQPNEILMDGAFMSRAYMGKKIMPEALSRVSESGRDKKTTHAITLVEMDNTASLKGCYRAGFHPYLLREVRWRLFREDITYKPTPSWAENYFYKTVGVSTENQHQTVANLAS